MSANHKKNKKQNEEPKRNNYDEDVENLMSDVEEDGNIIVEMTDSEGNVYLYEEEMIIPIDDKKFALLVALPYEDEEGEQHHHGCDCGCEEEDVIIAKIVENADGEEEYIEPTDEEFEIVRQAYDDFFSEEFIEEEEQAKK